MRFRYVSTSIATVHLTTRTFSASSPIASFSRLNNLFEVKQDHGLMVKQGTSNFPPLQKKLLQAYTKTREFDDADKLFDEMPVRDIVSWNMLIHSVIQRQIDTNQKAHLGFSYLNRMFLSKVSLDHVSFIGLIRLCSCLETGIQLHSLIVKQGFNSNCNLSTTLVDFYSKCGHIAQARQVFDTVLSKDLVLWNVLISSYVLNGMIDEAFSLLKLMREEGIRGDHFTFSSLLTMCKLEEAKQIHAIVFKLSFEFDIPVATALVNVYAKSNHMRDALKCFQSMLVRNVVSWNVMILGFGLNGEGREAMRLLVDMFNENLKPDEFTFATVLSSCAKFTGIKEIKQVQGLITKFGYGCFLSVANSLVNAYSKTGNVSEALLCFHSTREPDLVSWTSVIGALAFHGFAEQSLTMFEHMLQKLNPDKVIFLEVLSACSHGGLVQEGLHYFKLMTKFYNIKPEEEHYTCLIDLLGRAGLIDEAIDVLKSMSREPSVDALAAFTGACNIHEKRESMKWGAKILLKIEPNEHVNYSLLSKGYVSEGDWNQAALLRRIERRKCNNLKTPGISWLGD